MSALTDLRAALTAACYDDAEIEALIAPVLAEQDQRTREEIALAFRDFGQSVTQGQAILIARGDHKAGASR